jgi:integrase
MSGNPWDVLSPKEAEKDPDTLFLSVGRALTAWERMQQQFAHFFGFFCGAENTLQARRAYGAIGTFRGQAEVLRAAAEAYFHTSPDHEMQKPFFALLKRAGNFAPRRNDIAHGIVQFVFFEGLDKRVYNQALARIGSRFGSWSIKSVQYQDAKQFYRDERAPARPGERERLGQANNALRVARLVWEYFVREELAHANPFRKVRLSTLSSRRIMWTRGQVENFVATADRLGHPEIGTAVMLAFELCQRQSDILALTWEQIASNRVTIRQDKTDALVWIPLKDLPEVLGRLEATPRKGTRVVTPADGRAWGSNAHQFRKVVRRIAQAAGIPDTLTYMDLRRSGLTELGNAGATDDEIRSVSGHLTREVVKAYVLPNDEQAAHALEKRRKGRTERG